MTLRFKDRFADARSTVRRSSALFTSVKRALAFIAASCVCSIGVTASLKKTSARLMIPFLLLDASIAASAPS